VDKVEALQELVDQRRENQRLKEKLKRKRRWKKLSSLVSAVLLVSFAILFTRVTPIHMGMLENGSSYEVVISGDQIQTFDQHYTTELENGFCLYGGIEDQQVVVNEVVYVDEPRQRSKGSISFTCIPETLERLPELLKQGDLGFLGIVHTHPSGSPRLSRSDAAMLGASWYFVKVSGIYNGDRVEFYAFEDPRYSMPLQVN
jgi:proteasome lid subunit RPN8/RPN11